MKKERQLRMWEQTLRSAERRLSANEEAIDVIRSARMPEWKRDNEIIHLKRLGEGIQEEVDEAKRQLTRIRATVEVQQLEFGGVRL